MRKKIRGILLAAVFGMLTLGATAFAEEAVKSECLHHNYWVNILDETYTYANSEYHWAEVWERHFCNDCSYFEDFYHEDYEVHSFDVYGNGTRYCSGCGCEDEFYN